MNTILQEKVISFKEFEKKIFDSICEIGRTLTTEALTRYDQELAKSRDVKAYRDKGGRKSTIKTIYGSVEYSRRVYKHINNKGKPEYIYLLDEAMKMDKIGLISTNLAEKIVEAVTQLSYRATANDVSSMTGQAISHGGAWNLVQALGEKINQEESALILDMKKDALKGEIETPILFEEMDGVYINIQGKDRPFKKKSREMKVSIAYSGWKADGKSNSTLVNKVMTAGFDTSKEFHQKREAMIKQKYNTDEIKVRILNGDGAEWIKDPYEGETIFQLDPFHIYQAILRNIKDKISQKNIRAFIEAGKIQEAFEYIEIYADSVATNDKSDKTEEKARKLLDYLKKNEAGIVPYNKRGIQLPEEPEGIVYKNLGTLENHNCTVITLRMKHRRASWSIKGANNMAKILVRKENKTLYQTIERYMDAIITSDKCEEIIEILSAAKTTIYDGKGNKDGNVTKGHLPMRDALMTESRKAFLKIFDMKSFDKLIYR